MAKRFTSTEIWEEDWFIEMPMEYKLFWFFLKDKCNHAGLFKVNVKMYNFIHSTNIEADTAFKLFNKGKIRLRKINGSMWLMEDFFFFQYGKILNTKNTVHQSIKVIYEENDIDLKTVRGLKEVK